AEEAPARTKRPKKLKDPSEGGIDAEFVTGRRSAPSAAAKAAQEASAGKGRRQRGKAKEAPVTPDAEEEAAERRAGARPAPGTAGAVAAADDGEAPQAGVDARAAPPAARPAAVPAAEPATEPVRKRKRRRLVFG